MRVVDVILSGGGVILGQRWRGKMRTFTWYWRNEMDMEKERTPFISLSVLLSEWFYREKTKRKIKFDLNESDFGRKGVEGEETCRYRFSCRGRFWEMEKGRCMEMMRVKGKRWERGRMGTSPPYLMLSVSLSEGVVMCNFWGKIGGRGQIRWKREGKVGVR